MQQQNGFVLIAFLALASPALADEGMWTFDNFPSSDVQSKYGFSPSPEWLDKVRLSSVRLAQGCSGSFVSPDGLVMTNHHCAHECIEQLSTKAKDYIEQGFLAKAQKDEVKCPTLEVNQLVAISDVTERMKKATADKSGRDYAAAQKAEKATIEKECAKDERARCDVVSLYQGGQYKLYTYKRFQDVRLAFAPEMAIAFFGGDPDNFMFPRYDLDVSFVRVYEDSKPLRTANFFPFAKTRTKEGDLTFVTGHPGRTRRNHTVSQLAFERDVALPWRLMHYAELRGVLTEFGRRGPEQARISKKLLFSIENGFKALKGRYKALLDENLYAAKVKHEEAFKKIAVSDPKDGALVKAAWDEIAKATQHKAKVFNRFMMLEGGWGFDSDSFSHALTILRAADELALPNEKRLKEYRDSALPELTQELFSTAPIYPEFEVLRLTFALTKLREYLGADDPVVREILKSKSPQTLATEVVSRTKLRDPKLRQALFDGRKTRIGSMEDPLIALARLVDPHARKVRRIVEEDIDSIVDKNSELIAKARFKAYGTSIYPDATFTLRLSYGTIRGYDQESGHVHPITTIGGAFERATGEDPFKLPASWIRAKAKLALDTPMNIATTNDIIGGNSGSPVVNKDAEAVGLIFDGNIQSLGGDFGFEPSVNRAVAVNTAAILEALKKVYGAQRLVVELEGAEPKS